MLTRRIPGSTVRLYELLRGPNFTRRSSAALQDRQFRALVQRTSIVRTDRSIEWIIRNILISKHPRAVYYVSTDTHKPNDSSPPPFPMRESAKRPSGASSQDSKPSETFSQQSESSSRISDSSLSPADKVDRTPGAIEGQISTSTDNTTTSLIEDKKDLKKEKKLTIWQKIKEEVSHYWDGTKLLGKEGKISFRLALKMAAGYELSRRENRQLQRTTQDMIRLVPFSVFVIVPFAEFLLPVALKLFPNMLPSTYEGEKAKEAKRAKLSKTRADVSKFLRTTIQEGGLPLSSSIRHKEAFTEFFRKVRTSGEEPSNEDVINISKIFRDDLTLDNLSRAQLVAMCRYMNLNTFGTDALLRYQIRHHLRQLKRDDKAISFEGIGSLSVPELQFACAARGIRTTGVSPAHLRDDLQQWLDLRLKHGLPSTLLVLSNAYAYVQDQKPDSHFANLRTTLSSLPDELFHEAELEVHNAEGAATNKQRLEVLQEQEELIEDENEQAQEQSESVGVEQVNVKDDKDIDETEDKEKADDGSRVSELEGTEKAKSGKKGFEKVESKAANEGVDVEDSKKE